MIARAFALLLLLYALGFIIYAVTLGRFCERRLTPRNLLISARLN